MRTKKLKFNGKFYTVYIKDGGFFSKPSLEMVDSYGKTILRKKTHNIYIIGELFESDERLKELLLNYYKILSLEEKVRENDDEVHDLDAI